MHLPPLSAFPVSLRSNIFPADVLIGSAIGYLVGRYVYRSHHDDRLTDRYGSGSHKTLSASGSHSVEDVGKNSEHSRLSLCSAR